MSVELKFKTYIDETQRLYKNLCRIYSEHGIDREMENLCEKYNSISSEEKICLSFVGQYSAGKSTIIKAMTGDSDIVIDSDIATSEVRAYRWGENALLIDTPGLHTNENKNHDELAREAIRKSDLLVYCITSDLFFPVTREDFKSLLDEYRSKMFLVVNKMNKEAAGDYDELVSNYSETINKTLAPDYSLVDFHHLFFDAKDYIEGIEENDQDIVYDSHFEKFIEELNSFIELKGLTGKMLTPLTIMIESIDTTLNDIEDDEHVREGKQLIQKIIKVIEEKKRSFVKVCTSDIQKQSHKFIQKGDEIATKIGEKGFSFNDQDLQEFSDPIQDVLCKTVTDYFNKYAEEVDEEVKRVIMSEQAMHYFTEDKRRLQQNIKGYNPRAGEVLSQVEQGIGEVTKTAVPQVSGFFAKFANVSEGKKITLWTVNGSDLHKVVKDVGHKLGYKFKPFEALKISKKIATFSNWLGPVLTGVGTFVELIGIFVEKNSEKKLSEAKQGVKIIFKGMSEETIKYYNNQVSEASIEFDKISKSLQDELRKIEENSENDHELRTKLVSIKKEILSLKHKIEYN